VSVRFGNVLGSRSSVLPLFLGNRELSPLSHEKIFIARNDAKFTLSELPAILAEFSAVIADPSPESHARMKSLLRKYVKYYRQDDLRGDPRGSGLEI